MHRRYDPFEAVNVIWVTWPAHPFESPHRASGPTPSPPAAAGFDRLPLKV